MDTRSAVAQLSARAADQWGLVTAAQAAADGIDTTTLTRLVSAGVVVRLVHGVYQLAGATDIRFLDEKAAWLRLAPAHAAFERRPLDADGGVLSHRSAALLHSIGDLRAPQVEIVTPVRRRTRDPGVKFRRAQLRPEDVTTVEGLLPVTTMARTIADLVAEHLDGGHLGDLIADATGSGLLDRDDLAARVAIYGPAYGTGPDGHELIELFLGQSGKSQPSDADTIAALNRAIGPMTQVLKTLETPQLAKYLPQSQALQDLRNQLAMMPSSRHQ